LNVALAPPADLSIEIERQRLSPVRIRTYLKIFKKWGISNEESRQLLGIASTESYELIRQNPATQILSEEQIYRMSFAIGIYKVLHILHDNNLANRWIGLSNRNVLFQGRSPLAYMLQRGIPAMRDVRSLLDARCQG
jgi:hypothetical protein